MNELSEEKSSLLSELELMKVKVQSGDSKAALEKQLSKVMQERDAVQMELSSLKVNISTSEEKVILWEMTRTRA